MTIHDLPARAPDARLDGVIKLAVMAVGGQGGGVLTELDRGSGAAERLCRAGDLGGGRVAAHRGHDLLCRDVPGLGSHAGLLADARGGRCRHPDRRRDDGGGRAILRGFVTPDRTVADRLDPPRAGGVGEDRCRAMAWPARKRRWRPPRSRRAGFWRRDFDALAVASRVGHLGQPVRRAGRVRGAALPARGVRGGDPGGRQGGRRLAARLCAAWIRGGAGAPPERRRRGPGRLLQAPQGPAPSAGEVDGAGRPRCRAIPRRCRDMALAGLRKVVDFQDLAYGAEYLDRLDARPARGTTRRAATC